MDKAFRKTFRSLTEISTRFDRNSTEQSFRLLKELSSKKLPDGKYLNEYMNLLQFMLAYPANGKVERLVKSEVSRIASHLKKRPEKKKEIYMNSGLPFTTGNSRFSHDCLRWLMEHPDVTVEMDDFNDAVFDLNDVLKLTLPSVERSETTAGLENNDLLTALKVNDRHKLQFLVEQISTMDSLPYIKDQLFDNLGLYVKLKPRNRNYSLAYNKLDWSPVFYHEELLKKFDAPALLNKAIPQPMKLSPAQHKLALKVIRNAMTLTDRETDPTTYTDENSLRIYQLERGIAIALFGITSDRQLPLENYVGLTLFKNGMPAAYGGCWVFGQRANFGINVFEPYRGGESGFIICQLLRLYRQVFSIDHFEVEPYQFGLDNPDGIKSGAFWFYHRFGFRPVDKDLFRLSEMEHKKIQADKNYRSSEKTLIRFTESNVALRISDVKHRSVPEICSAITTMIARKYKGNRQKAVTHSISNFLKHSGLNMPTGKAELQVLEDMALWAASTKVMSANRYQKMAELISAKPTDMYQYQEKLLELFRIG